MGNQVSGSNAIIVFDKPYYYSGSEVTANAYFNIIDQSIREASIIIVGKEKTKWHNSTLSYDGKKLISMDPEYKGINGKKVLKNDEKILFTLTISIPTSFSIGQFSYPVKFFIPNGFPSSFEYIDDISSSSIFYYAQLNLISFSGTTRSVYCPFYIRQPPSLLNYPQFKESSGNISNWCSNKGVASFKVSLQKSELRWNDTAICKIFIDNTKCDLPVESLTVMLIQKLKLQSFDGDHELISNTISFIKTNVSCNPLNSIETEVNLPIQYNLNPTFRNYERSHCKEFFSVSKDENLLSTCRGNLISNEFYIQTVVEYVGCQCCSGPPEIIFPVSIFPVDFVFNYDSYKPISWNPQPIGGNSNQNNSGYDPFAVNININTNSNNIQGGYDPFATGSNQNNNNQTGYDPFK